MPPFLLLSEGHESLARMAEAGVDVELVPAFAADLGTMVTTMREAGQSVMRLKRRQRCPLTCETHRATCVALARGRTKDDRRRSEAESALEWAIPKPC